MLSIYKLVILLPLFIVLSSCGQKNVSDCDETSSSGGVFNDRRYDCPTGTPRNDDIQVDNISLLGTIEAGFTLERTINIRNSGDAKIFDFSVGVNNAEMLSNNCPAKLFPSNSCTVRIKIDDTIKGDKSGNLFFSDKTGSINKNVEFEYSIIPSYPVDKEILFDASELLDFDRMKVNIGPLVDRFGNIIDDTLKITSNRIISLNNTAFQLDPILTELDISGSTSFYVRSTNLEQSQLVDSADLTLKLERTYTDPNIGIVEQRFSISFLNNKPRISTDIQLYNINEDDSKINLVNLTRGEDYRGLPISYQLTQAPQHGVISDCLVQNNFITLVTCFYTPNQNYNGQDIFKYKAWNGESLSYEEATVQINIAPVNDAPTLPSGIVEMKIPEGTEYPIQLPAGFDVDGDPLTYVITTQPTKGAFSCNDNGRNCTYLGQSNLPDRNDFLIYKVRDPSGLESGTLRINIEILNVNEKPLLGGSESHSTVEDTPVNFTLTAGTDLDIGDTLVYRLKNYPQKGVLSNCLNDTDDLTCTYTPNKNEDSADSFSYVAVDSSGVESDPRNVTIVITQVNDAPIFNNLYQEIQTLSGNPVNFNLLSAIDPENNTIIYSIVSYPSKGNLSSTCVAQQILSCTYTPSPGVNNEMDVFTYRATDQLGAVSEIRTVKVIIGSVKTPPTLSGVLNLTLNEDEELEFTLVQGNDVETPVEFLKYYISSISPQNGIIRNCMDQPGTESGSDITCTYIPNENFNGTDQFSYAVLDGGGQNSSELIVNITVNPINDAPFFEDSEALLSVNEDEVLNFNLIQAIDLEDDELTYSLKINPSNGVISGDCFVNPENQCAYTPNPDYFGEDTFVVKVEDEHGLENELLYRVQVNPVNDAPVLDDSHVLAFLVNEDSSSLITLREATDIDNTPLEIVYRLETPPSKGVLSNCLGIGGVEGLNCNYIGKSNEVGIDFFSYKAYDGDLFSNIIQGMISITDINDFPFFQETSFGPLRVEQDVQFTFSLPSAIDLENDELIYEMVVQPTKGTLVDCFGSNGISSCKYTADEDSTGFDIIVYKARDSANNESFNTVQVSFQIEEAKFARVFKLKTNSPVQKPNSISFDDKVHSLNGDYYFNNSNGPLFYILKRGINKEETSISGQFLRNKNIKFKDEIFSFEDSSGTLKVINKEGVSNVSNLANYVLSNPVIHNDNIFWGSNQSTMYRLNLSKIDSTNYYYLDKLVDKSTFSLELNNRIFIPMLSFNGDLFFRYQNDSNQWLIVKMDASGKLERISNISGKTFNSVRQVIEYDNETNLKRVFFMVKEGEEDLQKIYVYDYLQSNINQRFIEISTNRTLQETLSEMKLYKSKSQDYFVFKDEKSSKAVYLRPDLLILDFISNDTINSVQVSSDKTRLVLEQNDKLKITDDTISLGFEDVPLENSLSNIDSFFGNRFFLKSSNNLYSVLNDSLAISNITVPFGFNYTGGRSVFENEVALWSQEGAYEVLYIYKDNFIYEIPSTKNSFVDGLIGIAPNVITSPNMVQLNNCFINSECRLDLIQPAFGDDNFTYTAMVNSKQETFSTQLKIKNEIPKEVSQLSQKFNLKRIINNFSEFIDYIALKDEFYISVKDYDGIYRFYRIINENELVKLYESPSPIRNLKSKDKFIFFTDKKLPNEVHRYDQNENELVRVFHDSAGQNMELEDIYINSHFSYFIVKNYGNPARDRLIKQDLDTLTFIEISLPSGLIGGKIFPINSGFYIVSKNSFAKFNEADNTFVGTQTSTRNILLDLSTSIDKYLVLTVEHTSNPNELNIRTYDTENTLYDEETNLFDRNRILKNPNRTLTNREIFKVGGNSPYVSIYEITNNQNRKEIKSIEKDSQIGISTSISDLFANGDYDLSRVKRIEDEYYFMGEGFENSEISFNKIGFKDFSRAFYKGYGVIKLTKFYDNDGDNLTYEIVNNPTQGSINNCLGINSLNNDLICDYIHTGESLSDSITYRVFDGKEYSENKTILISVYNTSPSFNSLTEMNVSTYKNINLSVQLDEAFDIDGNNLYYVVENLPSNGSLLGCNLSESNMLLGNQCTYVPNSSFIGEDSFTYYVTDGNKRTTHSKVINIVIQDANQPVFMDEALIPYISKNESSVIIRIPKAQDPNGNNVQYEIVSNPSSGVISNCFEEDGEFLVCTYTPSSTNRANDSFTYRAYNGSNYSSNVNVSVQITGSNILGRGDLIINKNGVSLTKNGINSTTEITSLVGYNWNNITKKLTLPAGKYEFDNFTLVDGVSLEFIPVDALGERNTETELIELYVNGTCSIDGNLIAKGGYSSIPEIDLLMPFIELDNNQFEHLIPMYMEHGFGGRNGGSSVIVREQGADFGTPTYFRGAEGQNPMNESPDTIISGGRRGFDGAPLFIKCLDEINGIGSISVNGENGENGELGMHGGRDHQSGISFGGGGGGAGGNGGHSGNIFIMTENYLFNGDIYLQGGNMGLGGFGGFEDLFYLNPNPAGSGSTGANGVSGELGSCYLKMLNGVEFNCSN